MTKPLAFLAEGAVASPADTLRFEKAMLIVYRLFDVADDIALDRAEALLAGAATRLKLSRERSEYLEIHHAPLTVHLGQWQAKGESGRSYPCQAYARLFAFGVLSVRYEIILPDEADCALAANLVHDLEGAPDMERAARAEAEKLCQRLAPALDTMRTWEGMETYTALFARGVTGAGRAAALGGDARIAKILLADPAVQALSREEVADAMQHSFSYTEDDLCVIDWNAAVVVEPDGSRDIPDVLEFASAQLLELRFYDDLVDREMESLYGLLDRPRMTLFWWLGGRYRRLVRQLNRRLIETVEFVERVDNSIKVIADSYLARVYSAALVSFRVPNWLAGVNRKQDLTRQVAEVLTNESQAATSHLLELVIILLILFEIFAPLLRRLG